LFFHLLLSIQRVAATVRRSRRGKAKVTTRDDAHFSLSLSLSFRSLGLAPLARISQSPRSLSITGGASSHRTFLICLRYIYIVRPALLLLLLLPLEASSFVLAFLPSFKLSPEEKKSLEGKLSRRASAFLPQNRPAIAPFRRDRKKKINKSREQNRKKIAKNFIRWGRENHF
jgi:hypothetical protein